MDMITISAKTLDEAITEALLQLQTTSEHLYYEIVQEPTSGVFGLFGGKPCIIRVKVMTEEEEREAKRAAAAKENEAAKPKEEDVPVKEEKATPAPKPLEETEEKTVEPERKKESPAACENREDRQTKEDHQTKENRENKENRESRDNRGSRDNRENRDKKRHEDRKKEERKTGTAPQEQAPIQEEKPRQPVKCDPEKVQQTAREFLEKVFAAMGMQVELETSIDLKEGDLMISMSGNDMGILIGKRGQTLDSLQYLTSLVVNRETEGYLRVKLDTENYRERRKQTLETLARNIAYKVKRTKKPVSLEPMNPYERRIIHSTLQGDRYVVTRSEGEDPYRHVVISLKNDHSGSKGSRYPSGKKSRQYDRHRESPEKSGEENE